MHNRYIVCREKPYGEEYLSVGKVVAWRLSIDGQCIWFDEQNARETASHFDAYVRELTLTVGEKV